MRLKITKSKNNVHYLIIKDYTPLNGKRITKVYENLGISSAVTHGIFSGLIEVTSGCLLLSETSLSPNLLTIISTFLISFGGLSIHAQAYCYLKNFDMSYSKFLLQKFTQALISTFLAFVVTLFITI